MTTHLSPPSAKAGFDFMGVKNWAFAFSGSLVIASVLLIAFLGLNFGIDFTGGVLLEVRPPTSTTDISALRKDLSDLEMGAISLQSFGEQDLLVRVGTHANTNSATETSVANTLKDHLQAKGFEIRRVEVVGPQVGGELIHTSMLALGLSLLGITLYILVRFEFVFSIAGIIALVHDIIVTIGFFALTRMEFDLSTVAAVLMISGYSINDTVVVYDRIRENLRRYKSLSWSEIMNISINQTLSRSLLTSSSTLLAVLMMMIFGGEVIRSFIMVVLWGITMGAYSSIFIAAPLLTILPKFKFGAGTAAVKS